MRPVAVSKHPATQRSGGVGYLSYLPSKQGQASQPALLFPSCTGGLYSVITTIKPVIDSLGNNWEMSGSDT